MKHRIILFIYWLLEKLGLKNKPLLEQTQEAMENIGRKFKDQYLVALSLQGYVFLVNRVTYEVPVGLRFTPYGPIIIRNPKAVDKSPVNYLDTLYRKRGMFLDEEISFDGESIIFGEREEQVAEDYPLN